MPSLIKDKILLTVSEIKDVLLMQVICANKYECIHRYLVLNHMSKTLIGSNNIILPRHGFSVDRESVHWKEQNNNATATAMNTASDPSSGSLLYFQGRILGGEGCPQSQDPPSLFWGTPKLHNEGENVAYMPDLSS